MREIVHVQAGQCGNQVILTLIVTTKPPRLIDIYIYIYQLAAGFWAVHQGTSVGISRITSKT